MLDTEREAHRGTSLPPTESLGKAYPRLRPEVVYLITVVPQTGGKGRYIDFAAQVRICYLSCLSVGRIEGQQA